MPNFERQHVLPQQLSEVVKAKWSEDVLQEGYIPFPKRLLRTLLSLFGDNGEIGQLAAILAAIDYKRPKLSRPPSAEYLAFTAGIPIERFNQLLASLAEKGWAEIRREPKGDIVDVNLQGLQEAILNAIAEEEAGTWVNLD
jgi:hypothetical protein